LSTESRNWRELEQKIYMQVFKRNDLILVRGKGVKVWDETGKEYLDFVAGLAVNSLGHCHPVMVKALNRQSKILTQTSNLYYTIPQIQLSELLVKSSCLDRVFICNSGAEANEGAIKLARRYGKIKLNGAYEIITTTDSFHGRTLATTAATGQNKFQEPYTPLPTGFVNVNYNDIDAVKTATNELTCAIMLEPIQGEGGVNIPDDDYLKKVRAWCDEKGILLILDEIQTGIGRTGTLYAYQQYGVEPDIMTLAKGMGSGIPIGALLAKEKVSVFKVGEHGGTFVGNPLMCAAAYEVMKYIIDENIPAHVLKMGQILMEELNSLRGQFAGIKEIRGKGLMVAITFKENIATDIMNRCAAKGLLINNVKPDTIRLIPPLIIDERDIRKAVDILNDVLKERQR